MSAPGELTWRAEANARLIAAAPDLLAACELASTWLGSGNALEDYESIGEIFYRDTGMLRPGKSMPLECGDSPSLDERQEAFRGWANKKAGAIRIALRDAIVKARGQ